MTINQMRAAIAKVYDSESWKIKVDRMYDDQVIAVYLKFERQGKFKPQPDIYPRKPFKKPKVVQLSFDDIPGGLYGK